MLSLSNLSALAGLLSLAAVAVDAKPVPLYAVEEPAHYRSGATNTQNAATAKSHHYDTAAKNVTGSHRYQYGNATDIQNNGTADGIHWGNLRCPNNMSGQSNHTVTVLPTPTYGTRDRVWMVCAETLIRAAPREVYDALLDFGRYRAWNSYVTDVEIVHPTSRVPINATTASPEHHGKAYEGMEMQFTFHGLGGEDVVTTGPEVLTVMRGGVSVAAPGDECPSAASAKFDKDDGYLMSAWRSDLSVADELIRSEHPNVVTDAGDGYARLVSWETYYDGKSTETFKLLRGQMQALQERQGADLKAYLEKRN
ncbi:hypothetical protein PG993_012855 [Apiospora rasikravindrae]|uniref:Uncharacterized protein n=1 Tax=Apiospora rasikravindrae TaxID=990691 RepID=A0ABR1RWE5_9PEZI